MKSESVTHLGIDHQLLYFE